jgi:hypothetical protein
MTLHAVTTCQVCKHSMILIEPGQLTHPACDGERLPTCTRSGRWEACTYDNCAILFHTCVLGHPRETAPTRGVKPGLATCNRATPRGAIAVSSGARQREVEAVLAS